MPAPSIACAAACLLVLAVTGGCTSTDGPGETAGAEGVAQAEPTPTGRGSGGARILQPGRPGQPAETLDPDVTLPAGDWNDSDAGFLTAMIAHHAQALEMADLARSRAYDEEVRALARRIGAAQSAEIVGMSAWLHRRGLDVPTAAELEKHAGMSMHTMPGMLTPDQMDRLAAADGAGFDARFVAGMIAHHRGAVAMARQVQSRGNDIVVREMADEVAVEQIAEIQRMRDMLPL